MSYGTINWDLLNPPTANWDDMLGAEKLILDDGTGIGRSLLDSYVENAGIGKASSNSVRFAVAPGGNRGKQPIKIYADGRVGGANAEPSTLTFSGAAAGTWYVYADVSTLGAITLAKSQTVPASEATVGRRALGMVRFDGTEIVSLLPFHAGPQVGALGLPRGKLASLSAPLNIAAGADGLILAAPIPADVAIVGDMLRYGCWLITNGTGTLTFKAAVGAAGTTADLAAGTFWVSKATAAAVANGRGGITDGLATVRSLGAPGSIQGEAFAHADDATFKNSVTAAVATKPMTTSAKWFFSLFVNSSAGTVDVQQALIEVL